MSAFRETLHTTVAQSASVSGDIDLRGARAIGIAAPAITSCQLFLQANYDQTSGNFFRAFQADGSAQWAWSAGVGSAAVVASDVRWPFRYARIETGVPQADTRSFAIVAQR